MLYAFNEPSLYLAIRDNDHDCRRHQPSPNREIKIGPPTARHRSKGPAPPPPQQHHHYLERCHPINCTALSWAAAGGPGARRTGDCFSRDRHHRHRQKPMLPILAWTAPCRRVWYHLEERWRREEEIEGHRCQQRPSGRGGRRTLRVVLHVQRGGSAREETKTASSAGDDRTVTGGAAIAGDGAPIVLAVAVGKGRRWGIPLGTLFSVSRRWQYLGSSAWR